MLNRKVQIIAPSYKASLNLLLDINKALLNDFQSIDYSNYVAKDERANEWRQFYAASPEDRATDLKNVLFSEDDFNVIWTYRGGRNCAEIIEHLPIDKNDQIKKEIIFIGFSDITALHYFFNRYYPNIKTIHAINARGKLSIKFNLKI